MRRRRRRSHIVVDVASSSAEPFRALRLALALRPDARTGNILLFTSAEAGDGKSTVATNYALVSSYSEGRVLLVDADLRNPSLHLAFHVPRAPGLVEVLAGGVDHASAVQRLPYGRIDLLPAGAPVPRLGDLAASTTMANLLSRLSDEYDLIVLDSPPVERAADAVGLASHAGVDVAVVTRRAARLRPVRRTIDALRLVDANVLGVLVNREGRLARYAY